MLAKETTKETSKVLKKAKASEPIDLDKKTPQKKEAVSQPKTVMSKVAKAKQVISKACIDDAVKLSATINLLSSKMDIVYLHETYKEFNENAEDFFKELPFLLKSEDFKKWESVYKNIYEKQSSKDWIQKYPVDDLFTLCNQIEENDSEEKIRKLVEDKLAGNYKTAINQSDKALNNLLSFYEKISFDLLDNDSLDKTYILVKRLYNRFRSQMDKKSKR
jgi:hypothetical protein